MAKEWLAVDESAKSLLKRTLSRRISPVTSLPPLHRFPLHAGHVLEIVGPSNSGKSETLLQAAIACILPKQSDGISYGGSEGVAMMFDLDCRFDMLRFIDALQLQINGARAGHLGSSKNTGKYSKGDDHVFTGCLKRFFYIRCHNSFHFLAVLKTLHAKFKRLIEAGLCPHLLMIDSINAFYWVDRSVSSVTSVGPGVGRTALSLQMVSEAVVRELSHILESYPMLILSTKSLIQSLTSIDRKNADGTEDRNIVDKDQSQSKEGKGRAVLRDFMPAVWQGFVTHRLLLRGPFQPGTSLQRSN
ncbi:hypothetical protein GOP47_0013866 [Adiantum capillus-veneris]|uniref:DNA repair protein XRCC2 homolog n=1 Tax=Adiantum capillus-veneris TaxID=13818 RepID=A0A9D4UPL3_ADICA|nr:hypothetical protein GOP47_0013866 [Adiantum capillus-veneris]